MRLDKAVALAGLSRSEARKAIQGGRVLVDGAPARDPAMQVEPGRVRLDGGGAIEAGELYLMVNKPAGVLTATEDRRFETVLDLLPEVQERIYPIGRLDMNTEGLLLLTNDGELMNGLLHPRYEVQKTYVARLAKGLSAQELRLLREGVQLEDGLTAPARVRTLAEEPGRAKVEITIHEGRNRQVRRMFQAVGHEVLALKRVAFAGLTLEGVRRGGHRALAEAEVKMLYEKAGRQPG